MRILGIDPGSTATGYGLVDRSARRLVHVGHGILRPPRGAPLAARLSHIHEGLVTVIRDFEPDVAVVEKVFLAANPRSALVLGQARGAALAALAGAGLDVGELAAREVKKAVAGSGAAGKPAIQAMVARLLGLDAEPPSDAADALAVAICQAHIGRLSGIPVRSSRRRRTRARSLHELTVGPR
jgi:crossover junction endodeoxyribonuclease RuvC